MKIPARSGPATRLTPALLLGASILLAACGSPQQKLEKQETGSDHPRRTTPYSVVLTYNDRASRAQILYEDMGWNVKIEPITSVPYSDNASTAIWIGTRIPPDQVFQIVDIARRYYMQLRYVALSDRILDAPDIATREIQVGMPTETALKMGLDSWTEKDFDALKTVKTEQDLRNLVESKYSKKGGSAVLLEDK